MKHNRASYTHGCRCDTCKAANARYAKERIAGMGRQKVKKRLNGIEITHGASGYANWACRCETCTKAWTAHCQPAADRFVRRTQGATLEKATRSGYQWTGPELELAGRSDLTAKEVALMIGRSFYAVQNARSKLRAEPKVANLAGIAKGDARGA
ncbi:MAG: hypothetical protein JWO67_1268 [Streptosporangiaceae bacterium]|nr:hypothetical protein [Streptosporangiaceae bacterium]